MISLPSIPKFHTLVFQQTSCETLYAHKITIAVAAASAFFVVAGAHAQEVVTFGHSAPLTGPQAPNGKDNENGARLAIEEQGA